MNENARLKMRIGNLVKVWFKMLSLKPDVHGCSVSGCLCGREWMSVWT